MNRVKSYYASVQGEEDDLTFEEGTLKTQPGVTTSAGEDEDGSEEDEIAPPKPAGDFMSSLFGATEARSEEDEEDYEHLADVEYGFDDDFEQHEEYEEYGGQDDADEEAEDKNRNKNLEARLSLAFQLATAHAPQGHMKREEFGQALSALGKMFTTEETDQFYKEAIAYQEDKKSLRPASAERDARGLLRRSLQPGASSVHVGNKSLDKDGFRMYYLRWLTRSIDAQEAEDHFRALVEGAAEIALRSADTLDDESLAVSNRHLEDMKDTKNRDIGDIFIYARDLRRVLVNYAEKLTDEEADQLIRECRHARSRTRTESDAGDGGLERIYFEEYLAMLRDETL